MPDEVWQWLLKDAESFAAYHISKYRWRGAKGGVLPGGFDASSLAAEAVMELFQPREAKPDQQSGGDSFLTDKSHDFLSASPVKAPVPEVPLDEEDDLDEPPEPSASDANLPKGYESDCRVLRQELHHRVRRQINRLWHLKERLIMHNVEDLARVHISDSETVGRDEALPTPELNPEETLGQKEQRAQNYQFQEQFHAFLAKEPGLQSLYACIRAGIHNYADLARKLKITERGIHNRLRRLRRRAAAFLKLTASERSKKNAKYFALQIPHPQRLAKAA